MTPDIPDEAVTHDPCCSSHNVPMTCERYRNTHFVQVRPCCSVDSKRLDDEIGLTDEAWIDVVAAVGWDESNKLWPVLRTALAAALPVLNTTKDAETTALRDALGSIRALVAKYHERDDSLPADLVDEVYALTSAASLRGEQGE